jgi:hypothetical protein
VCDSWRICGTTNLSIDEMQKIRKETGLVTYKFPQKFQFFFGVYDEQYLLNGVGETIINYATKGTFPKIDLSTIFAFEKIGLKRNKEAQFEFAKKRYILFICKTTESTTHIIFDHDPKFKLYLTAYSDIGNAYARLCEAKYDLRSISTMHIKTEGLEEINCDVSYIDCMKDQYQKYISILIMAQCGSDAEYFNLQFVVVMETWHFSFVRSGQSINFDTRMKAIPVFGNEEILKLSTTFEQTGNTVKSTTNIKCKEMGPLIHIISYLCAIDFPSLNAKLNAHAAEERYVQITDVNEIHVSKTEEVTCDDFKLECGEMTAKTDNERCWKKLMLKYHPDKNMSGTDEDIKQAEKKSKVLIMCKEELSKIILKKEEQPAGQPAGQQEI